LSQSLAITTALYALCLAGMCVVRAVVGRPPDELTAGAFIVLAAALVLQAVLGGLELARGYEPPHPSTAIGYLVASVVIVPIVGPAAASERSRWGAMMLAVAAVAVAVVSIRLAATWGS
jgi:hypothetical protein